MKKKPKKKTEILVIKSVYDKILMYQPWHDYVKPKQIVLYGYSFIVYIKTDDIYKDIAKMLKQDLKLEIMNQNAIPLKLCYQKVKIKMQLN